MRMVERSPSRSIEHRQWTHEDVELTAFVQGQIDRIMSSSHEPRPACCPRCGSSSITTYGSSRLVSGKRRPQCRCKSCGRFFTRLIGTLFENRRYLSKIDILIPLLSQSLSFREVGERMGSLDVDIKRRVLAIRKWLLEIDPTGKWERRVKIGGRFGELQNEGMHFDEAGAQEDCILTDRLTRVFDEINSFQTLPYPKCVYCGGSKITIYSAGLYRFPRFWCGACSRNFSRRTGTVFSNFKAKHVERMRKTIRYLSLPLSFVQVSDEFQRSPEDVERWRNMFIVLADQLEPNGSLSSRIRLGIKPTKETPCPLCGRIGTAVKRKHGWGCSGCGRQFSMRRKVIDQDGRFRIVNDE